MIALSAMLLLPVVPMKLAAQDTDARLKSNREELERVRRERAELQQRMNKLQSSAHSLNDELKNINKQHDATKKVVSSLDQQLGLITDEVKGTTSSLVRAEDEAETKRAILNHRLIEIYKRGPLFDFQALLSADSFGELIARYKYLHEIAVHDRALVKRMDDLRTTIRGRRRQLVSLQSDVQQNRVEKAQEEARLQALESQRQKSLVRVQADSRKTQQRLASVKRSESKLNDIISSIEAARRRGSSKASAVARGASSIKTSDYGKLDWPVDGNILYNFGRVVRPDNTTLRWNGIGIAAASGTAVHSVAAGDVVLAGQLGTYGQTVIVEHGGGDYSVYGSLSRISVAKGAHISKGEVVGEVGTSDPDLPPHLHFEIRHGGPAVDPTSWLRGH
ncbi:MAG TPA: peptidoglycan DD-metalloendopeptidase family protein [Gemmatimonadaceae bacterium]|nr:peptidoglycan DD-metalloendopeptidase family protein [Gemmatimonadaceae bacterium]